MPQALAILGVVVVLVIVGLLWVIVRLEEELTAREAGHKPEPPAEAFDWPSRSGGEA